MRKLWMDGLKYALVSSAALAVFWNIWNLVTEKGGVTFGAAVSIRF